MMIYSVTLTAVALIAADGFKKFGAQAAQQALVSQSGMQPHRQGGEVAHPAAFGLDAHAVLGGLVVALAEVGRLALELLIGVGAGVFVVEGLEGDALGADGGRVGVAAGRRRRRASPRPRSRCSG
jgi:hypothetical protein